MTERDRIDQLSEALEAVLADPRAASADLGPPADPELAEMLRIAKDLCDLPRPAFKARLAADLERRAAVTETTAAPTREALQSVTAYLAVRPAVELIEFVKRAFGAQELLRTTGTGGGLHAEVRIGDTKVMIGGGEAWGGTPTPAELHLYVPDTDQVYSRALEAGAVSLYAPVDQPYGDREAGVSDLAGNHWFIATHQGGEHIPAGLGTVTPFLHPRGAERLVAFLEQAFSGEAIMVERAPDETIKHAKVRVGRSVVEMGEANGPWQPKPTMFYLYVDDVDVAYQRALAAGAASLEAPAVQPYGERRAAVRDAFDNLWYLAAPVR
jgi:PhnB protein